MKCFICDLLSGCLCLGSVCWCRYVAMSLRFASVFRWLCRCGFLVVCLVVVLMVDVVFETCCFRLVLVIMFLVGFGVFDLLWAGVVFGYCWF